MRPLPDFHPLGLDIERPAPPPAARRLPGSMPRTAPSLGEIDLLMRRARRAGAMATTAGNRARASELRRSVELLETLGRHHERARVTGELEAVVRVLKLMLSCFNGPLMSAAFDGAPVDADALERERAVVGARRKRLREEETRPTPPVRGVAYRATRALRDRAFADLRRRLGPPAR